MKKKKLPSLVTILILTLITVVVWVTFDIYRLFNKADNPVVPESVSLPLNPNLDIEAINQFESKLFLDGTQIPDQVGSSNSTSQKLIESTNSENQSSDNTSTASQ